MKKIADLKKIRGKTLIPRRTLTCSSFSSLPRMNKLFRDVIAVSIIFVYIMLKIFSRGYLKKRSAVFYVDVVEHIKKLIW